jgi:hypothetical protein
MYPICIRAGIRSTPWAEHRSFRLSASETSIGASKIIGWIRPSLSKRVDRWRCAARGVSHRSLHHHHHLIKDLIITNSLKRLHSTTRCFYPLTSGRPDTRSSSTLFAWTNTLSWTDLQQHQRLETYSTIRATFSTSAEAKTIFQQYITKFRYSVARNTIHAYAGTRNSYNFATN